MEYNPRDTGIGDVAEQGRQQSQQLARQARQQASELANRGTEQLKSQLANQKHDASQRMTPIQTALRESAQQLRKQGQGSVGHYADRTADQLERFSGYLRETEVDEIMEEVRSFARRRPALFVGSAVALGFLGTRFLKSSSQEQQQAASAPNGSTSRAAVSYGATEGSATALLPPAGEVEGEPPTLGRPPTTEPSRGS